MAGREAHRNRERLEYKFITEYIKATNKDIYDEANSFYQMVKTNNPRVSDLTKTVEFMVRAKPNQYIPRYYYNRKGRKTTPTKQTEQIMCLNIPLMTTPLQTTLVPPTEEPTQSPQPTPAVEEPLQSAPPAETSEPTQSPQPTPAAEEPLQSAPPAETSPGQLTEEPLPPLSEENFQELILELNRDPDLSTMFPNFDIPSGDDENMNPQVWNDIQINTTPMEIA